MNETHIFSLSGRPFVALHHLLKLEGLCHSGGQAKQLIDAGLVTVDGEVERRKRCKILAGQVVAFDGDEIQVLGSL